MILVRWSYGIVVGLDLKGRSVVEPELVVAAPFVALLMGISAEQVIEPRFHLMGALQEVRSEEADGAFGVVSEIVFHSVVAQVSSCYELSDGVDRGDFRGSRAFVNGQRVIERVLVPVSVLQLCNHRTASHVLPFPFVHRDRASMYLHRFFGAELARTSALNVERAVIQTRHSVLLRDLPLKLFSVKGLICLDQDGAAVRTERVQDLAVVSLTAARHEEPEFVSNDPPSEGAAVIPHAVKLRHTSHTRGSQRVVEVAAFESIGRSVRHELAMEFVASGLGD